MEALPTGGGARHGIPVRDDRRIPRRHQRGGLDMQTVYSKKVDRIRSWIARNTENMVVCRFSCRMCSGKWSVAWIIPCNELQDAIHRPRTVEGRNPATLQLCSCGQGPWEART